MSEIRLSGNPFTGTVLFERVTDGEITDMGIVPVTQGGRDVTPGKPAIIDTEIGDRT